ncbi:glycosyltransferase family 4 protein [Thermoproteota archaeon]
MKIAALVHHDRSAPSANKRVYELKKNGLDVDVYAGFYKRSLMKTIFTKIIYLMLNFPLRLYQVFKISMSRQYKVVIIQRLFYEVPLILKMFIKMIKRNKKIIFDFDDSIFLYWWDKGLTKFIISNADAVTVGSHFLEEYAKRHHQNVRLIPTSIDTNRFKRLKVQKKKGEFIIGWSGQGRCHLNNLKLLQEPIFRLLLRNPNFHFKLMGAMRVNEIKRMFNYEDENINKRIHIVDFFPYKTLPKEINSFDVGLMPLVDGDWEKGKCSLKALEYMACGVVPIVSDVGENRYVIKNYINGLLVKKEDEWIKYIEEISKNKDLKKKIAHNAVKTIKKRYNIKDRVTAMNKLIKKLENE